MIRFEETKSKFDEAAVIEIPKILARDVKRWDSLPLGTKEEFRASYDKLEDDNDSPGCAYLIARFSKDKKVMQTVLYITAIHFTLGSIPYDLQQYRYAITNPLWNKIMGRK
jgi:hypothetical protein